MKSCARPEWTHCCRRYSLTPAEGIISHAHALLLQVMYWFDTTRRKRARQDGHPAKQAATPGPLADRPTAAAEIIEIDSDNDSPGYSGPTAEPEVRVGTPGAGAAILSRQHADTDGSDVKISAPSQSGNWVRMSSPEKGRPDNSPVEQPARQLSASADADASESAAPADREDAMDEVVNIDEEDDVIDLAVEMPALPDRTAAEEGQSGVDAQALAESGRPQPASLERTCRDAEQAAAETCGQKTAAGDAGGQMSWTPQLVAQKRAELEVEIALAQEHAAKLQPLAHIPTEVQPKDKRSSLSKPEVKLRSALPKCA